MVGCSTGFRAIHWSPTCRLCVRNVCSGAGFGRHPFFLKFSFRWDKSILHDSAGDSRRHQYSWLAQLPSRGVCRQIVGSMSRAPVFALGGSWRSQIAARAAAFFARASLTSEVVSRARFSLITLGMVFLVSFFKEFHNDEFGFIMKINLPHRMNQGMNQWKKMRNCSMWVYKKKKRRKNEKKKKNKKKGGSPHGAPKAPKQKLRKAFNYIIRDPRPLKNNIVHIFFPKV